MVVGFGAVPFDVLVVTPGGLDTADFTVMHIPGGSVNYVDVGGQLPNRLELMLYFDDTNYDALRLLVGTQDTLEYPTGTTYTDALLASLRRVERLGANYTKAEAVFIGELDPP
jgi:hypothetical protein